MVLRTCDKQLLKLSRKLKLEPHLLHYKTIAEMKQAVQNQRHNYDPKKIEHILETYQIAKYSRSNDLAPLIKEIKNL